jgi:protein phosphatase PTC7
MPVGVADGVGGWNSFGVNPALFAWELMDNAKKAAEQLRSPYPWTILDNAYKNVVDNGKVTAGSSTASIVSLGKFEFHQYLDVYHKCIYTI